MFPPIKAKNRVPTNGNFIVVSEDVTGVAPSTESDLRSGKLENETVNSVSCIVPDDKDGSSQNKKSNNKHDEEKQTKARVTDQYNGNDARSCDGLVGGGIKVATAQNRVSWQYSAPRCG